MNNYYSYKLNNTLNLIIILLAIPFTSLTSIELKSQEIKITPIKANKDQGLLDNDQIIAKPDADFIPLFKIHPIYPRRAQERGTEGFAIVSFTITDSGSVEDAKVISGACGDLAGPEEKMRPCTIFNKASIRAALKLKYMPKIVDGKATKVYDVSHRFLFSMEK
ncbi:energy transducer TonB [Gammaproteobacteria bacterium]|nr:energy transducer TonB [Gammaproteobacteria bacterium]